MENDLTTTAPEGEYRRLVYLDHAATSPLSAKSQSAMRAAEEQAFGNPNSGHWAGATAERVLDAARETLGRRAGFAGRVILTSGATEANAIGILGLLRHAALKQVLASAIEHDSVFAALDLASALGAKTDRIGVDHQGVVSIDHLRELMGDRPSVVAVMHANNEVGTLQPIREIAEVVHATGGVLHVDAAQSYGKVDLSDLGSADTIGVSAHKLGGPKGVGALLVREGVFLDPPLGGGSQEYGLRRGTQNVPGIAGFARAAAESDPLKVGPELEARATALRSGLVETIPEIRWTGDPVKRAPHIVSCVIPGVAGDVLAQSVSALGVAISVGSACHASSGEPSHVLRAMGAATVEAACAVRLSVGLSTSDEDIAYAIEVISECVRRLRSILLAGREDPLLETVERIANDISSSQEARHEP